MDFFIGGGAGGPYVSRCLFVRLDVFGSSIEPLDLVLRFMAACILFSSKPDPEIRRPMSIGMY